MPFRPHRTFGLALVAGCAVLASWCSGGSPTAPSTPPPTSVTPPVVETPPVNETPQQTPTPIPPASGPAWINVFGDTGWCGSPVMGQLATLLTNLGGEILLAGDLAYDHGTIEEFRRCFDPAFGRFRNRIWASPGNHDYMTPGAAGYFTYFGERAGPDRTGHYAVRIAGWHVLMLNSNVPMTRGSTQYEWVRRELTVAPARCTMAVWHHPFDSSGPNGPNPHQRDLWELLHNNSADLVVSGHDHLYERHAPMNPSMQSDPTRGIRLFVSGGGGAPPYQRARAATRSELMISTHGMLRLKLDPALYEWEYLAPNGNVLDRGLNICH